MKKNVGSIFSVFVFIGLAILMNLCYFLIPYPREHSANSFWILYGASMFFLIAGATVSLFVFGKKNDREKVFGIAVFRSIILVLAIQILADIVLFIIGSLFVIRPWIVIIIEASLFVFFAAKIAIRLQYQRSVKYMDEGVICSTKCISGLKAEIAILRKTCHIPELKRGLDNVYEKLLYCDPVSTRETEETEKTLLQAVEQLKTELYESKAAEAEHTLVRIEELILIRAEQKKSYADDDQM